MDSKKDKGASAPEARVCGNCLAPEGQGGVTLTVCPQCKLTPYCSKPFRRRIGRPGTRSTA